MATKQQLIPLKNFVLIERVVHAKTDLHLPDSVKKNDDMVDFVVVAKGPDCADDIKPMDVVYIAAKGSDIATVDDTFAFVRDECIIGRYSHTGA